MEKNRKKDALASSVSAGAAQIHRRPPSRERAGSPNSGSSRQGHRSIRSPNSGQQRKSVGQVDLLRDRRDSIGPQAESAGADGLPGSRFVDKEDPNLTSTWRVSPVQKQQSFESFTFPRSMRTGSPTKEVSFVEEQPQRPHTVPTMMTVPLPGKEMTFRSFREGMCLTESRHAASKSEARRRASGMSAWQSRRAVKDKDPTWEPPDPKCTAKSCFSEAVQEATKSLQLRQGTPLQSGRQSPSATPLSLHDQRPTSSRGSSRGKSRNGPRSPTQHLRRPITPAARLSKLDEFLTIGKQENASTLSRAPPWTLIPEKKATQHPALLFDEEYGDDDDDYSYRDLPGLEHALAALPPTELFGGAPRRPPTPKMMPDKVPERRLSNLNPGAAEPQPWSVNGDPSTDTPKPPEESHMSLVSLGSRFKQVLGMNSFRMKKQDMMKRFITVPSQQQLEVDCGELLPELSQLSDEPSFGSQDGVLQEPSLTQIGPVPPQKGTGHGPASAQHEQHEALDQSPLEEEEQEEDESNYASGYSRSRSGRAVRGRHSLPPSLPTTHESLASEKTTRSRAVSIKSAKQETTQSSLPRKNSKAKGSKAKPGIDMGIDMGIGLNQESNEDAAELPDPQTLYPGRILEEKREKMRQEMALKREELLGPVLHMLVPEQDRSPHQVEELGAMEEAWRELLVNRLTRAGVWSLRNPSTREVASASIHNNVS